jgi:hypothetical protein
MIQLVREIPIRVVTQGALSSRRGFLFYLAAGFSKELDPLSGMSVNLTLVDRWLSEVVEKFGQEQIEILTLDLNQGLMDWGWKIGCFLRHYAEQEEVKLSSLCFREERGWAFTWNPNFLQGQWLISYSHFLESVPTPGVFDLLKVKFIWLRVSGCEANCQHEGFKLLKTLSLVEYPDIIEKLRDFLGKKLTSGTTLKSIEIEYLGERFSLKI